MTKYVFSLVVLAFVCSLAWGHGIHGPDRDFIEASSGLAPALFIYLGAKHMITGYDHLFYLAGVVFFLGSFRDIIKLVSLFALGHSITLLFGVLANVQVNAFLIDAVIGFSIVYKAHENLGGFKNTSYVPSIPLAVFLFGLVHGLGLATKLQEFSISSQGLVANIISFNIGVEVGQIIALGLILIVFNIWRKTSTFTTFSAAANVLLMVAGFVLMGYQLTGYFINA